MTEPTGETDEQAVAPAPDDVSPTADSWEDFEARLVLVLTRMAVDTYLVLTTPTRDGESSYYVQFSQAGRSGFLAEAVSNHFLSGTHGLSPLQEQQMTDLAWQWPPPHGTTDLNFSRQWPMPAPFEEVARLAIRTLREVYGIERPSHLAYKRFARGGHDFAEPGLGIDAEAASVPRGGGQPPAPTLAELGPLVDAALREFLHTDELVRDERGNIPIRMGSAMLLVRTLDGTPPIVQVFSPILRGVDPTGELLGALNDINAHILFGRVLWTGGEVILAMELSAVRVTSDDIAVACLRIGGMADHLDDELADRFGAHRTVDGQRALVN